jgi:hypothetical protein
MKKYQPDLHDESLVAVFMEDGKSLHANPKAFKFNLLEKFQVYSKPPPESKEDELTKGVKKS